MTSSVSRRWLLTTVACWASVTLLAMPAAAQECIIRPFGDSITAGTHGDDWSFKGGYREPLVLNPPFAGTGRTIRMSGNHVSYSTTYLTNNNQAWNTSYPGWRMDQLWSVTQPIVAAHIVLVHAGTNDLHQGQIMTAAHDLDVLVRSILYYNPTARVLVAKIIPFRAPYEHLNSDVYWFNLSVGDLVVKLKAEGWTRVDMVDMNTSFPSNGMGKDGIHPNDAGYKWMALIWKDAINRVGCN